MKPDLTHITFIKEETGGYSKKYRVRDGQGSFGSKARRSQRVVPPVPMVRTTATFFFHVGDFSLRGDLAIFAGDAPASECREPQEPH